MDLNTRTVRTVDIRQAQSWWERLLAWTAGVAAAKGNDNGAVKTAVVSPGGQHLFVLGRTMQATRDSQGNWHIGGASLGLHVIAVRSGTDIARCKTVARTIGMTPDGKHLLLTNPATGEGGTDVLATNGLQREAHLGGWQVEANRQLNGQPVLLASQPGQQSTQLALLDPRSFAIVHAWTVEGYATWVTRP